MNEAERPHVHDARRQVLDSDAPAALVAKRQASSLEDQKKKTLLILPQHRRKPTCRHDTRVIGYRHGTNASATFTGRLSPQSLQFAKNVVSYSWCEALDLKRDRIRAIMALLGSNYFDAGDGLWHQHGCGRLVVCGARP